MDGFIQALQDIINAPEFLINSCTFLPEFFRQAMIKCVYFIPLLYFLYFGIELLERFILKRLHIFIKLVQRLGALLGIAISIIPECGYQVIASTFYTREMISKGTLLAFLIMCSDEALPLLFMDLEKVNIILPLLAIKAVVAIVTAIVVDIVDYLAHLGNKKVQKQNSINDDLNVPGCCHHMMMSIEHPAFWYMHPFTHTVNIFVFSLITLTVIYGLSTFYGSTDALAQILMINSPLQVVLMGLIGLASNCVMSVVIALAYVNGIISFPALVACMISVTGLGLATLTRQNTRKKNDTSSFSLILLIISIATGLFVFYYMQ